MAKIFTPPFIVSYPNVFKPKFNKFSKKNEYTVQAIFPKGTDLSKLKALVQECIEVKWDKDPKKHPKKLQLPFKEQNSRAKPDEITGKTYLPEPYVEGGIYLDLMSEVKPGIKDPEGQDIVDPVDFYAGCIAVASINIFAYDKEVKQGVSFRMNNLFKRAEGTPITGRATAEEEYAQLKNETPATPDEVFGTA